MYILKGKLQFYENVIFQGKVGICQEKKSSNHFEWSCNFASNTTSNKEVILQEKTKHFENKVEIFRVKVIILKNSE